jgi:uncharacterized protein (TIGR02444 family)
MNLLRDQQPDEPGPAWPPCPFWDWAEAFYARPGVAETCLGLQDRHGHDVILVLFALWLAERGVRLDDRVAVRALSVSTGWREAVVAPLRTLRRQLKAGLAEPPDELAPEARQPAQVIALRARIKALELASERLQILALAELADELTAVATPGIPTTGLARNNLEALIGPASFDLEAHARLLASLSPLGDQVGTGGRTGST